MMDSSDTPLSFAVDGEALYVDEVLRTVEGVRVSGVGRWRDRDVFAKVFVDPLRSAVHARREEDGAALVARAAVPSPTLLATVELDGGGGHAVLFERLRGATSVADLLADQEREPGPILTALADLLTRLHENGIEHRDPHLGNFLMHDGTLHAVDTAALVDHGVPMPATLITDNLALLLAQLDPRFDARLEAILDPREIERDALLRARARHRRARRERFLKKMMRTCRECLAFEVPGHHVVLARPFAGGELEEALRAGPLDDGDHRFDERPVAVVRTDAARTEWRNAHWLRLHSIPTPAPVALIEKKGWRRGAAWIVRVGGHVPAEAALAAAHVGARRAMIDAAVALVRRLGEIGSRHGALAEHGMVFDVDGSPAFDALGGMSHHETAIDDGADERDLVGRIGHLAPQVRADD